MKILPLFVAILGILTASLVFGVPPTLVKTEQALIVHFNYGLRDLKRLFELEDKLEAAISKAGVGQYDGNEVASDGKDGYLYMYGPNVDRLFEVVRPILESTPFLRGAQAKKRYGPPTLGVGESTVIIKPSFAIRSNR